MILPVHNQPMMLDVHLKAWSEFDALTKRCWELIVIDDCSTPQITPPREYDINLRIFRSLQPMAWNRGLKNLGAIQARGEWLLQTDADHVMTNQTANDIARSLLREKTYYKLRRRNREQPNGSRYNRIPHINTFLIHRNTFFAVGGYDEDLSGNYGYTDSWLETCLTHAGYEKELLETFPLENYSLSQLIPDADFVNNKRDGWPRDTEVNAWIVKDKSERRDYAANMPMIRFDWVPVLV